MFLIFFPKFRSFFADHPVAGVLLLVIAIAALLALVDLWRMRRQTPKN